MAYADGYATSGYYSGTYDSINGTFTVTGTRVGQPFVLSGGPYTLPSSVTVYFNGDTSYYDTQLAAYNGSGWMEIDGANAYFNTSNSNLSVGTVIPLTTTGTVNVTSSGIAAVCFLEGTRIACPGGERAVEDLAIGDRVLTATGEALPLRWIGRQERATLFADPASDYPIRIGAGALGNGLPRRDLYVSPAHALLVEGVLVQARVLVNGTSIVQARPEAARFTYFHLEFESHVLVLAEGAPAESFCNANEARSRFDNHAEFTALYGKDAMGAEPCALPRVTTARQMPRRLQSLLATRATQPTAADVLAV